MRQKFLGPHNDCPRSIAPARASPPQSPPRGPPLSCRAFCRRHCRFLCNGFSDGNKARVRALWYLVSDARRRSESGCRDLATAKFVHPLHWNARRLPTSSERRGEAKGVLRCGKTRFGERQRPSRPRAGNSNDQSTCCVYDHPVWRASRELQQPIGKGHLDLFAGRCRDVDQAVRMDGRARLRKGPLELVRGSRSIVWASLSHIEVPGSIGTRARSPVKYGDLGTAYHCVHDGAPRFCACCL